MSAPEHKEIDFKYVKPFINIFLSYTKYIFLTSSVVFSLAVGLFIILSHNPNISMKFLTYLSFLNPKYATDSFSMGISDIMHIFLFVSLILFVLGSLLQLILKKAFGVTPHIRRTYKIITFFAIITIAYVAAIIIDVSTQKESTRAYYVFILFYMYNIGSLAGYFFIEFLQEKMNTYLGAHSTKKSQ